MTTTFIGVDLAWAVDRNHTGIVVLRGDAGGARFVAATDGVTSLPGIVDVVRAYGTESMVVAIDAPLIVTNATGFRECEREIGRRFGRFHASCHSNNLTRTPHPAMVVLFGLERVIKYKKGSVSEKRAGLVRLQRHLLALTGGSRGLIGTPALEDLLRQDVEAPKGAALKRYEDTLDALFCAYLAWYCWRWGGERNERIGNLESGYIVVPTRR